MDSRSEKKGRRRRVNIICFFINLFGGCFFGFNTGSVAPAIQYVNELSNCTKFTPSEFPPVAPSSNNSGEALTPVPTSTSANADRKRRLKSASLLCTEYSWTKCTWSEAREQCLFLDQAAGVNCSIHNDDEPGCRTMRAHCTYDKKSSTCEHRVGWTAVEQGLVAGSIIVGATLGSLGGGYAAQKLGRRRPLIALSVSALISIAAAIISWQLGSVAGFITSRVFIGVSVGLASVVCPLYVGEMAAPRSIATKLGLVFQVGIVSAGYVGAILLYAYLDLHYSTLLGSPDTTADSIKSLVARYHVFHSLAATAATGLLISSIAAPPTDSDDEMSDSFVTPSSNTPEGTPTAKTATGGYPVPPPRSSLSAAPRLGEPGNPPSSQDDLLQGLLNQQGDNPLGGSPANTQLEIPDESTRETWPMWKVVLLTFALAAILQAEGVNALLSFAPTMMKQIGIDPATGNLVVFSWFWFTTFFTFCLSKFATPRKAFGYSSWICVASCVLVGVATLPSIGLSNRNIVILGGIGIGFFAAAFHAAIGPYFFFLSQSMFPPSQRDLGCRLAQIFQFSLNVAVNVCFPIAMAAFNQGADSGPGLAAMFFIFAALGTLSTIIFFVLAPKGNRRG